MRHGEVEEGHGRVGLELVLDDGLDVALLAEVGVEGLLVLALGELDHHGPEVALAVEVVLAHVERVELEGLKKLIYFRQKLSRVVLQLVRLSQRRVIMGERIRAMVRYVVYFWISGMIN